MTDTNDNWLDEAWNNHIDLDGSYELHGLEDFIATIKAHEEQAIKKEHAPCSTCGTYTNLSCSNSYHIAPDRLTIELQARIDELEEHAKEHQKFGVIPLKLADRLATLKAQLGEEK